MAAPLVVLNFDFGTVNKFIMFSTVGNISASIALLRLLGVARLKGSTGNQNWLWLFADRSLGEIHELHRDEDL